MSLKMANEKSGKPAGHIRDKIKFSIVFKLNARLTLRLLGVFLVLDFFLCCAGVFAMTVYAERTLAEASVFIGEETGQGKVKEWLDSTDCTISPLKENPKGIKVPQGLQQLFPQRTASGARNVSIPKSASRNKIAQLFYSIELEYNGSPYVLSIDLSWFMSIFRGFLLVLFILEFLMLIRNIFLSGRIIRTTLRPIAELAQTAQSLNTQGQGAFTPEEMKALAGKLDGINAAKLDTRIAIDGTQDELKNLAHAINGMLDRINESYRSQARFVSDASHELRTPISVIQGYANLLDRWGKNDEKTLQESIDAIKDEAANMKGLVEQLLFLARGDNNTMSIKMEQFDLSELAQEVLKEAKMIDGGHEYSSSLSPVSVFADAPLIKQALRILIDNAVKYTPSGGHISISVSRKEKHAWVTVQDDGIGIPPEAVPQVFERFYRADESRARSTGGTGLGLSITKWIAQRHGGYMEVLSREDVGTKLSIVIPAVISGDE
ncbi:ATP-binding protein [Oscillospiraceae bacterium PP1C4]